MQFKDLEFWFIVGSQFLYGEETLRQVEEDAKVMVEEMNKSGNLPLPIRYKTTVKTCEDASNIIAEANYDKACAGIIVFCHTFSPSKMWINGLIALQKPYLHFHSQFLNTIPNEEIDMDYMNLHQSAHGDREHAFMGARLGLNRKIVVGYWKDKDVQEKIGKWMRASAGVAFSKQLKLVRFGDNMREVGVTEGDKVEAQIKFGWQVNTWPVGDLVQKIQSVTEEEVDKQVEAYEKHYVYQTEDKEAVRYQALVELGMKKMLEEQGAHGFTNTFENLYGMEQLPGLATQDLMRQGYGFGAEGDWKVSAMTAIIKFMSEGLTGGNSFIEDYTYDFEAGLALGAHMLEVCPSIATDKARIEVHPLGIGGKKDPARLVFEGKEGPACLASLVQMGNRFRLLVHEIDCVKPHKDMPNLPTARVMWEAKPNLADGAKAWMLAGGAHHSTLTYDLDFEVLQDFCRIMDIECVHINAETDPDKLEEELFLKDIAWKLK